MEASGSVVWCNRWRKNSQRQMRDLGISNTSRLEFESHM